MFSALDSDSEDEKLQTKPVPKQTNKDTQHAKAKNQAKQKVATSDFEDGTVARGKDSRGRGRGRGGRGRGDRARGDRGRGRGRGGFGGEGYDTEVRGGRGRGRGGRGRGRGERGRGRGRFDRGRGRGGYRGRQDQEGAYSHLATKEQVLSKEELEASQAEGAEEHATEEFGKHGGYDKRSGTGHGREVKKGGAGKGGWGVEETDNLEHRDAEAAAEIAEGEQPATETEEAKVEGEGEAEGEGEPEANTMSYAEYLEKRKQDNANLTKTEARAPEEIKLKNIQKHEGKKAAKGAASAIKAHESYAPTGIKSEVDLGFGAAPDSSDDDEPSYNDRGRGGRGRGGRGRGGRGRGSRGGFNER